MDIDVLIEILIHAKTDELKKVKILRKDSDMDSFYPENITGISYDFSDDSVLIFPEYF